MRYAVAILSLLLLLLCAGCGQKQPLTADVLSTEEIQSIVFTDAGVTDPSAVAGYRIQQDWEDGKQVYEVEFFIGQTEYDYELDAATGEILSFEMDND